MKTKFSWIFVASCLFSGIAAAYPSLSSPCQFKVEHWQAFPQATIEGRLANVTMLDNCFGATQWLSFTVHTDQGEDLTVLVAPSWYLRPKVFRFALGDDLHIQGAFFESQGKTMVMAGTLQREEKELLTLRDSEGRGVWNKPKTTSAPPVSH